MYAKNGLLVALSLGAAVGLRESLKTERAWSGGSKAKARAYAEGIATGLNCAALIAAVCVPGAVLVLLVKRTIGARQ
jgi:hypothetical protein